MRNKSAAGNKTASAPVLLLIMMLGALRPEAPLFAAPAGALLELTADVGTTLMQATWRCSDAQIVETLVEGVRP